MSNAATAANTVRAPFQVWVKVGRGSELVSGKVYESRAEARAAIRALRAAGDTRKLSTFPCTPETVST